MFIYAKLLTRKLRRCDDFAVNMIESSEMLKNAFFRAFFIMSLERRCLSVYPSSVDKNSET